MESKREKKKVLIKTPVLNKDVEKAVLKLVEEINKCELDFNSHLKQPAILTGLINKHLRPVLVSELEKERL